MQPKQEKQPSLGHVFRGPEGLLIWCDEWTPEKEQEARRVFPWWNKAKISHPESLEDFAPTWKGHPAPSFLFKEANTGRIIGSIPS